MLLTTNRLRFPVGANETAYLNSCARVYRNSAQSINDSTLTALAFNNEQYDTDGLHDNATNNSRLTCVLAGKYAISAGVEFDGVTPGSNALVLIRIVRSDTVMIGESRQCHPAGASLK